MTFVKGTVLLLLLAAVITFAEQEPEDCGQVKKLENKNFDQILGEWVLVWAVSNNSKIDISNVISSHVEISLHSDNNTVSYIERNMLNDGSCIVYNSTAERPTEHLRVEVGPTMVQKNGTVTPFHGNATLEFFETCPDSMMMLYDGSVGKYLLSYKKDGHHVDIEKNKECHKDYERAARCNEIPTENGFTYTGVGDFCHKKSSPEQA